MTQRRTRRWWRERYVATHYAKVNAEMLAVTMKHKGFNTVTLAAAVGTERSRLGSQNPKITPQRIGQLRNGVAKSCSVDLAEAIETVLGLPPGLVFSVQEKPSVKRNAAKAHAA